MCALRAISCPRVCRCAARVHIRLCGGILSLQALLRGAATRERRSIHRRLAEAG